jgi:hypothetical protein
MQVGDGFGVGCEGQGAFQHARAGGRHRDLADLKNTDSQQRL